MASIREVAERSGVSIATVSRVFNGSPRVSDETRERVLSRARELDYVPRAAARTLVRQRSQLIGVVLDTGVEHPDLQHPFFQEVLVALKRRLGASRYDLLLFADEEHGFLRRAHHHQVDGVVLMGADARDPEVERLLAAAVPTVAIDVEVAGPRATVVSSDNVAGGRLAVAHLHDLGHERIATIHGPLDHKPGRERLAGYRAELELRGLAPAPEYAVAGDFYAESGAEGARRLLELPEPPTAVVAASDMMAVGAIQALHDSGLRVPADVAVVGFDDSRVAELVDPPLTTIRQDMRGIGAAAGDALVALIESAEPVAPVTLPVALVVRGSTRG